MKNKPMSQQENQERTNQAIEIEDLTVEEEARDDVKGGANNLTKGWRRHSYPSQC